VKLVPTAVNPSDVVRLEVSVTLDPGFHTYGLVQPELKELASEITLDALGPLEPAGEWSGTPAEEKVDEVLEKRIFIHHTGPTWERELKVPAGTPPGEYKITGKLRLTVCNEFGCLPPRTEKFEVTLTVGSDSSGSGATPRLESATEAEPDSPAEGTAGPSETAQEPASSTVSKADSKSEPTDLSSRLGPLNTKHIDRRVESVGAAIGFGLLAGLILNVMPCVLPVISLKVYGFVKQAHQEKARIRLLGLSFSAGIIFVFLLFGVTFAYFGQKWGDLLKYDSFVVFLIGVLVLCTLWLFEVIILNPPGIVGGAEAKVAQRKDLFGEFFKGMLATVLSTPCSGPLLIPVTSFAIGSGSPPIIFATLAAVGIGMALPYVVLACNPAWMRILPKPGDWMRTFKESMAFLLLGTVVWLLWTRREKGEFVFWIVAFSSFVALAGWIYGRCADPLNSATKRRTGLVVATMLIAASAYFCFGIMYVPPQKSLATDRTDALSANTPASTSSSIHDTQDKEYHWKPFELETVLSARAAGRTVVVDWTAKW
jgi:thiol:disulfide interchange protein